MSKIANQPAYPVSYEVPEGCEDAFGTVAEFDITAVHIGLTVREYAAIRAMLGLIQYAEEWEDKGEVFDAPQWVANRAAAYADALIAELEKDE